MYTVPKNQMDQRDTPYTLRAWAIMIQPALSALCSPHTQELLSIIHHSHQIPPLSLILYSLYLILYDLNVYYTSRREILLSFEFSGYRALKNLSKFVGNILQTPDPPPWFCVQPVSRHFGMFFLIGQRE